MEAGLRDVPAGRVAAVVTSLEMRAAPAPRAGVPDPPWRLRHVPAPDPGWYRDLYRRVGEEWLWFSRLRLGEAELEAIIRHPQVEVHALLVEGRDEGLLELDFREEGSCELAFLGLTRALIGRGAGGWLMDRALGRAWRRPITRFWVHTCTLDHPGALAFYLRSGFAPFHRQVEIADDPRLDGTLRADAAPHVPLIAPGGRLTPPRAP